ncbi:TetR/AcrR family transcriptional regulator [Microbacterium sp. NPDC076895]|uniref:TetR/AcrR family transcriptional regulator n=1 Tax=Microbacterium sp. NPDC076895 TaxID=3154957 RepID=UPI003446C650
MATRLAEGEKAPAARRAGRPPGPTAQGEASRAQLIDAAAAVFARLGYDRARMSDIVQASGLSKGAVYFYFDSKESLAVAVLASRQEKWITGVAQILDAAQPGLPRLRALLPAMLTLHRQDPDAWVISRLSQTLAEDDATREVATASMRRWIDLVAEVISSADPPAGVDPKDLARVVVGAFDGLKALINIVGEDAASVQEELARAGALLERMLIATISR